MFAQLGNIQFENLKSFNDYSRKSSAIYAEHSLIEGKPRLQRTGTALDEISISIRLHASFCDPTNEIDALYSAMTEGEIMPLLWGTGHFEGKFVITQLDETIEDADKNGEVFSYVVSLTLKEYDVKNKVQQVQTEIKKDAKAVGDKKAVSRKKVNTPTCPQAITKTVTSIENHWSANDKIINEKGGAINAANKSALISHSSAISNLANSIITKCETPGNCVSGNDKLKNSATTCRFFANEMKQAVQNNTPSLYSSNTNLRIAVKNLKSAAHPLVSQSVTRK